MTTLDHPNTLRQRLWSAALTMPGYAALRPSLLAELAEYLGRPVAWIEGRCRAGAAELAQAWQASAPQTVESINAFYQTAEPYLYDLTWWHALGDDESALIQVEALEVALGHHAHTALDFGSGIGSLALLLAAHGLEVSLAEVNPHLQGYARWRFARRGLTGHFLDLSGPVPALPTAAYDFISAVDVFEHLPNPGATLLALAQALRPGGTLYIHLPATPDAAHPMHLWHRPATLLRHLEQAGLWLEPGPAAPMHSATGFVLRRGTGPQYRLNQGLRLVPKVSGGVVHSAQPLAAIQLNAQAFGLLAALGEAGTALEVAAARPGIGLPTISTFLETMARRRLLLRRSPAPTRQPTVSVIVPAYGRPAATRACVESLLQLDYPQDRCEIIVVDDATPEPLAPALAGLAVRIVRLEANQGQSAARNLALGMARGDLIAFIDNDCVAAPAWLGLLVAELDDPRVGLAGGRVLAAPAEGLVAAFEAVRSPLDMGALSGPVGPNEPIAYLPSCNLVVRRDLLQRVGGFDPAMTLGEDVDLVWRLLASGSEGRYLAESTILHDHRVALAALLRRRADYASSEADLQRRHPAGRRVMVLPTTVLLLLIALLLLPSLAGMSLLLGVLALLSLGLELAQKQRRLRQAGLDLPFGRTLAAVLAAHRAALYHLGANLTRYYSLPLLLGMLLWPALRLPLAILLLVPPLIDYDRLNPPFGRLTFIGLTWLELAAYQIGVWRGCWQRRTLRPLLPRLRLMR